MENSADGTREHGDTTMSNSSTATDASSYHTAVGCSLLSAANEVPVRDAGGASTSGRTEFFSPRIESMMHRRNQCSNEVEHEIEHSKPHWTEVRISEEELQENRKVFEELMKEHPNFFVSDWRTVKELGRMIAEGGQAKIFEVQPEAFQFQRVKDPGLVLKVFKRGPLSQMRHQWPQGVLRRELTFSVVNQAMMLKDGRFAFVMKKCWGDLRKLIDQAMHQKNMQGPPFPFEWNGVTMYAEDIMFQIGNQMEELLEKGMFHRDLKTSNILFDMERRKLILADFECSIGVVGTTFWRAPEILLALKKRDDVIVTEKADVYSFGMTCFEIVTGRLPFECELEPSRESYDLVIEGRRPTLPSEHLHAGVRNLITKCWDPDPNNRPTFSEIRLYFLNLASNFEARNHGEVETSLVERFRGALRRWGKFCN